MTVELLIDSTSVSCLIPISCLNETQDPIRPEELQEIFQDSFVEIFSEICFALEQQGVLVSDFYRCRYFLHENKLVFFYECFVGIETCRSCSMELKAIGGVGGLSESTTACQVVLSVSRTSGAKQLLDYLGTLKVQELEVFSYRGEIIFIFKISNSKARKQLDFFCSEFCINRLDVRRIPSIQEHGVYLKID